MKICILHRPNAMSGGDWVALTGYGAGLRDHGVEVDLRSANDIGSLKDFDYVHLWAACSPDWGLPAAREAKRQGKKLIITPFWWSRDKRQEFYGRKGLDLVEGYTPAVAETLKLADALFTVTRSEAEQCLMLAPDATCLIVPVGIDNPIQAGPEPDHYILCVGRIEPHKNQHSLAAACNQLGHRLVLLGQTMSEGYTDLVRDKGGWVVDLREGGDLLKAQLLARARVHALPSFFENPGLVHMESLAAGVPSVMGSWGTEPEFFSGLGQFCDPSSVNSIAEAIEIAWKLKRVRPAIFKTWSEVAEIALKWMRS